MFCKIIKTGSTRKATGEKYPDSISKLSTSSSTFFTLTSITDSYRSSQTLQRELDDNSHRTSNATTKSVRWDIRASDNANNNDTEFSELFYSACRSNGKRNSHRARTSKSSGTIHSNSNSNNNTTSDSAATTKPLVGAARRIRSFIVNQKFGTTRKNKSGNIVDDDDDSNNNSNRRAKAINKERDINLDETKRDSSGMESSTH